MDIAHYADSQGRKSMSRNDIMEDLQQYMDDLESDLHRAREREEM